MQDRFIFLLAVLHSVCQLLHKGGANPGAQSRVLPRVRIVCVPICRQGSLSMLPLSVRHYLFRLQ